LCIEFGGYTPFMCLGRWVRIRAKDRFRHGTALSSYGGFRWASASLLVTPARQEGHCRGAALGRRSSFGEHHRANASRHTAHATGHVGTGSAAGRIS
jgi:hypothetical protein